MKKIIILALHLGYGGVERSIVTLANMLAEKKEYEVEIASIYQLYDKPVFPLNERVKVTFLLPKNLTPNREEWKDSLKKKKFFTFLKESAKSVHVLYARKKEMVRYIKNTKADVMISSRDFLNEWLGLYGSPSTIKIGWEHNHHHNNMKYATDVVRSAKDLNYFVLVSKDLYRFYKRKMAPYCCKCVYIPNTLDNIPKRKSSLTAKRIISVGRLSPEKGFLDLLKIYQMIEKQYPDWTLEIIGDGTEKKTLQAFIKKTHLEDKVTLAGFQDSDYIAKEMQKSSLYIMTSYTESFGIVLLEAMSHGLPCLAFDSAEGAREIITSGRDGYLIRHRNFDAMVKKAEDLIQDEKRRKELGQKGREKMKEFSKEKVVLKWIALIEKEG